MNRKKYNRSFARRLTQWVMVVLFIMMSALDQNKSLSPHPHGRERVTGERLHVAFLRRGVTDYSTGGTSIWEP